MGAFIKTFSLAYKWVTTERPVFVLIDRFYLKHFSIINL